MATIKPATEKRVATIELTPEERAKIKKVDPEIFFEENKFPSGIRLIISEDEALSDEARDFVQGGILETP